MSECVHKNTISVGMTADWCEDCGAIYYPPTRRWTAPACAASPSASRERVLRVAEELERWPAPGKAPVMLGSLVADLAAELRAAVGEQS